MALFTLHGDVWCSLVFHRVSAVELAVSRSTEVELLLHPADAVH